jgi:hypothetical protein
MITTRYYKLNKSLDSFADYSVFRRAGLEPKNKIENLRSEIINYKNRLQQSSKKQISELQSLLVKDNRNYTHNIVLPSGDFYNLTWSLLKAKKVITENNIIPQKLSVKMLSECIAPGAVEQHHLELTRKNDKPIIIVELQKNTLNAHYPYIIIDGNHRLTVNILKNEQYIQGFLIPENVHFEALSSELDLVLYKIHCNKHIMLDYLFGTISKEVMENMLFEV